MFQTRLKIKKFGGSNPNLSFYFIFSNQEVRFILPIGEH
jgi:hypothetical protein